VSVFVDSSVWFAAMVVRDRGNVRAKSILKEITAAVTTDHVLVETCLLLSSRYRPKAAELFWEGIRQGAAQTVFVTPADLEAAWAIGEVFADQEFSIVDRTSFAVMERLGITRVASFDHPFAVYRYGRNRDRAFEVLR
jgi:predicted nucleic acid-binding protein